MKLIIFVSTHVKFHDDWSPGFVNESMFADFEWKFPVTKIFNLSDEAASLKYRFSCSLQCGYQIGLKIEKKKWENMLNLNNQFCEESPLWALICLPAASASALMLTHMMAFFKSYDRILWLLNFISEKFVWCWCFWATEKLFVEQLLSFSKLD